MIIYLKCHIFFLSVFIHFMLLINNNSMKYINIIAARSTAFLPSKCMQTSNFFMYYHDARNIALWKGCKEDPVNYRPVSMTSVPVKIMEQIGLREITWHVQDNRGIKPSQHGFVKGRFCLTNLVSFFDLVTLLEDKGKLVDVVYLDFNKAFDVVSCSIFLE